MQIKIKRINNGKLPEYKTTGASGADCYARIDNTVVIKAGKTETIPLGFAVEIPAGYEMQIRPRSGLARKDNVKAVLGTIDSDYRGEVCAIVCNGGESDFEVNDGDRIAQAVVAPVIKADWNVVESLSDTERGDGGFGSTGVKEVEKFYQPFETESELKQLIGKIVYYNGIKKFIKFSTVPSVIGKRIFVHFTDGYDEIEMDLMTAFQKVTIDGHRFGKEITGEESC